MMGPWLALALAWAAPADAVPKRFYEMSDGQVAAAVARVHKRNADPQKRLIAVSELFLGTPYKLGPLGEGERGEFDRDPLINFKLVDCTTMIEQAMALALEPDLKKATQLLQRIRYREGQIDYTTRNHFPELDWIPQNVRAGFLKDITASVDPGRVRQASKLISKRDWYAKKTAADLHGFDERERERRLPRLRELGARFEDQIAFVPYLPIESLPEYLPRIPAGTIVNLVREDKPDVPVLISHQGMIVEKNGRKYLRHAANDRLVEDVPALEYFYRYFNSKWRLLGLNLNQLAAPPR